MKDGKDTKVIQAAIPGRQEGKTFAIEQNLVRAVLREKQQVEARLAECEDLLASYGTDEHGAFPAEVDRYFERFGSEHPNWSYARNLNGEQNTREDV